MLRGARRGSDAEFQCSAAVCTAIGPARTRPPAEKFRARHQIVPIWTDDPRRRSLMAAMVPRWRLSQLAQGSCRTLSLK